MNAAQLTLDYPPHMSARHDDPATSKAAAHSERTTNRRRVLIALQGSPGLAYWEINEVAGFTDPVEAARRIGDLLNLRMIEPVSNGNIELLRMSPKGRNGRVYQLTAAGRAELSAS